MKEKCGAVIVAAGSSQRMGGTTSKMFMELCGEPVLVRCLEAVSAPVCIEEIVVVCRQEDIPQVKALSGHFPKVGAVVPGGETRQRSVENGLRALSGACTLVAIHDGARPLVTTAEIERVVADAARFGAATLAVPVKDTIKVASSDGFIENTPNRSVLWAVQTPQVFSRALYEEAVRSAESSGQDFTDDCQLMERLGHPVYLTRGLYSNLKITTPEDIPAAQALWREQQK